MGTERIDQMARGKGLTIAQMKVTRAATGKVEYHVSRPTIKPWDLVGWLWYFAHRRLLVKEREGS